MNWTYEKLDENYKVQTCPINDTDRSITGRIVMNIKAYFDENPAERIRRGWVKHITYSDEEMDEKYPHNHATQQLQSYIRRIDDYTIEDACYVIDKSERMMEIEELNWFMPDIIIGGGRI